MQEDGKKLPDGNEEVPASQEGKRDATHGPKKLASFASGLSNCMQATSFLCLSLVQVGRAEGLSRATGNLKEENISGENGSSKMVVVNAGATTV